MIINHLFGILFLYTCLNFQYADCQIGEITKSFVANLIPERQVTEDFPQAENVETQVIQPDTQNFDQYVPDVHVSPVEQVNPENKEQTENQNYEELAKLEEINQTPDDAQTVVKQYVDPELADANNVNDEDNLNQLVNKDLEQENDDEKPDNDKQQNFPVYFSDINDPEELAGGFAQPMAVLANSNNFEEKDDRIKFDDDDDDNVEEPEANDIADENNELKGVVEQFMQPEHLDEDPSNQEAQNPIINLFPNLNNPVDAANTFGHPNIDFNPPGPEKPKPAENPSQGDVSGCHEKCPAYNVEKFMRHDKCSMFCQCSNGSPILIHCPSGTQFNTELNVCDWPDNANCEDLA